MTKPSDTTPYKTGKERGGAALVFQNGRVLEFDRKMDAEYQHQRYTRKQRVRLVDLPLRGAQ